MAWPSLAAPLRITRLNRSVRLKNPEDGESCRQSLLEEFRSASETLCQNWPIQNTHDARSLKHLSPFQEYITRNMNESVYGDICVCAPTARKWHDAMASRSASPRLVDFAIGESQLWKSHLNVFLEWRRYSLEFHFFQWLIGVKDGVPWAKAEQVYSEGTILVNQLTKEYEFNPVSVPHLLGDRIRDSCHFVILDPIDEVPVFDGVLRKWWEVVIAFIVDSDYFDFLSIWEGCLWRSFIDNYNEWRLQQADRFLSWLLDCGEVEAYACVTRVLNLISAN